MVESVLVVGEQVTDADDLASWQLTVAALPPSGPRQLLVHLVVTEDAQYHDAVSSLTVFALHCDTTGRAGVIDALQPLLVLSPHEQRTLRAWLISKRWPAWARAVPPVRALLGDHAPPVLLAEAARAWMLPLATLTTAAREERLPTMQCGDRHLVYQSTIAEAQERGLLHHGRGRPSRRMRNT
jgi:hypothetical protein